MAGLTHWRNHVSAELQEPSALPAALRLPDRMREAAQELRADPLYALWLAGNVLGFLAVALLLATA